MVWKKRETTADKDLDFADGEVCWDSKKGLMRILTHNHNGFVRDLGDVQSPEHPTQKPLAVMLWCLSFSLDSKTVLDPYMGSGTTLRACKDHGKQCTGIEREERYCEIAARRLAQGVLDLR